MDIQRKAFEQLPEIEMVLQENPDIKFENGGYIYYGLNRITALAACYVGGAWMVWQAKAQAVPEINGSIQAHELAISEIKAEIEEGYNLCQDSYLLDVLVERGIEIGKIQAVPETQQVLNDRLLVKSIREHVESHIAEVSVNDLFDKGWLAAMKCIQNNIDMLEAQEQTHE